MVSRHFAITPDIFFLALMPLSFARYLWDAIFWPLTLADADYAITPLILIAGFQFFHRLSMGFITSCLSFEKDSAAAFIDGLIFWSHLRAYCRLRCYYYYRLRDCFHWLPPCHFRHAILIRLSPLRHFSTPSSVTSYHYADWCSMLAWMMPDIYLRLLTPYYWFHYQLMEWSTMNKCGNNI